MTIIKYDQVSLENLNYSKPEKIGPSYFGSFSYGGNLNPLYIQTPKLKCMSGIASLKDKKNPFCVQFVGRRYHALFGCLFTKF